MAQMLVRRANGDGKVNMGHIWAVLAIERARDLQKFQMAVVKDLQAIADGDGYLAPTIANSPEEAKARYQRQFHPRPTRTLSEAVRR